MDVVVAVLLVIVGLINAVPGAMGVVPGVVGRAYGVDTTADRNVDILLRHRSVLLFLVGASVIAAAFVESLRYAAMIGGAVALISFCVVVYAGGANRKLRMLAHIDVVAVVLLAIAAGLIITE